MIATYINAAAVIVGALIGLLLRRAISDRFRDVVTSGIGVITLVLGFRLGLESQQIVYLALSVAIGGLLGEWWKIEQGVTGLGAALHRLLAEPDWARQVDRNLLLRGEWVRLEGAGRGLPGAARVIGVDAAGGLTVEGADARRHTCFAGRLRIPTGPSAR